MRAHRTRVFRIVLITSSTMLLLGSSSARAEDWQWNVTPFVWASNLGVRLTSGSQPVDRTFSVTDLLKNLDWTAQVLVEAQHGRHGLMFDVSSSQLSKDSRVALPQLGGAPASLSTSVTVTIVDTGGLFNPVRRWPGFTMAYGTRALIQRANIDAVVDAAPAVAEHQSLNVTEIDARAGARYSQPLSRRLTALAHADISSGGTRYTWSGMALVAYALSESGRYKLMGGYRRMAIKLNSDQSLESKLTFSGIVSAVNVRF